MKLTKRNGDRREFILRSLNLEVMNILEIGALDRPIASPKTDGCYFADYATREDLVKNHKNTPTVNENDIVHVDFVIGDTRLPDVVPADLRFDAVLASHVVEHVPDMIGWLQDISSVLRVGGALRLIVPNAKKCFDVRRELTHESDLIEAYIERRRKPSVRQVYDFYRWHDRGGQLVHTPQMSMEMAKQSQSQYVDAHCWVYTPERFLSQVENLIELGLIDLQVEFVTTTEDGEIDFFAGFRKVR